MFNNVKQSVWTYLHSKYRKLKFHGENEDNIQYTHVRPNDMEATNLIIINILQTLNSKVISQLYGLAQMPEKTERLILLSKLAEANPVVHTVRNDYRTIARVS